MSITVAIGIAIALLAANAFFVGAEFSILSSRRSAIEPLAAQGNRRAQTVLWAMEHVSLMLAACQLGITACSVGLGVVAEPAIARAVEPLLDTLQVPHNLVHPIAFAFSLALVVYLHVVVGEMVPKNLSVASPDRAVLWFGPPLVWFARIVRPIIVVLNWFANHVVAATGVQPRDEVSTAYTAQEVQSIVEHSQAQGLLHDEQGLLSGALEFSEKKARDVMIPLEKLTTTEQGSTPADIETLVTKTGYSRFPVTHDGAIVGYLHIKDILFADTGTIDSAIRHEPIAHYRHRALAVARPHDDVEDALLAMQHSGAHLARVLEHGETIGVVFLEDILEELVGEVRDAMQRPQWREAH
ncbi:hemolysin family protein [Jonesia quinghaiensis]|uniref:hemolysin family protein n=1 Tax=Jonesia quinghaiensis TaxID=262806 RepID=UPI00041D269E|nr:hemolysin family protein [Jonesia quinghaiensis]